MAGCPTVVDFDAFRQIPAGGGIDDTEDVIDGFVGHVGTHHLTRVPTTLGVLVLGVANW